MRTFCANTNNCGFIHEFEPETGYTAFKWRMFNPLPRIFRRKATDSLLYARHSFDQAIFAACNAFDPTIRKSIYFPWSKDPTDLDNLLKRRKIPEQFWGAITAQEPYSRSDTYPGGDDLIRGLASVANRKHTVGLAAQVNIAEATNSVMNITGKTKRIVLGGSTWDTLKNEVVLGIYEGQNPNMGNDAEIRFQVLLKDSYLPHPVDALFGLNSFVIAAQSNLKLLKAACG